MPQEHGTAFPDWYITFQQAVLAALPRPPKLDQATGLAWANNGASLTTTLHQVFVPASLPMPKLGEWFELTVMGDAIHPLVMVKNDGHDDYLTWTFKGPSIADRQTRCFKLIRVGFCKDFDTVKQKVRERNLFLAPGQWREAYRSSYSQPNGFCVSFAGSEWESPDGSVRFPSLRWKHSNAWESFFSWASSGYGGVYGFSSDWLWLVEEMASYSGRVNV